MRAVPDHFEIKPDFSYFDNLYDGQKEQYQEMLDLYLQEYSIYKKTIAKAVETGNIEEFRKAKHKIIYSLHLLKLETIKSHLDEVSLKMVDMKRGDLSKEAKLLNGMFDDILNKLAGKRSDAE